MQFSGSLLSVLRNFYTQTGNFGFALNCLIDNTTGQYSFGLSGSQYNLGFSLNSGLIYYQNSFIHSYQPNNAFTFEMQVNTGFMNVKKDGVPMIYGESIPTGNFNYFYFQRSGGSLNCTFDLDISGDNVPNYTIQSAGFWISTGQTNVTGFLFNYSNYPINVFQSTAQNPQDLTFYPLTGLVSGTGDAPFIFSGNFNDFNFNYPILTTFNTNYNNNLINFTIYNATNQNLSVLFQNISNFIMTNNQLTRTLNYTNYSGGIQVSNFPANLYFQLSYVTGSGSFTEAGFAPSAFYAGNVYGFLSGSGFLTGQITFPTGNSQVTGIYEINLSQFAWATGAVTGFYSGLGTGIASGTGYTGLAIGEFSGIFTGFVYNNSGTLIVNSVLTGAASSGSSLLYPGNSSATGFVNISKMQYDDIFYINNLPLIKGFQFTNETGLINYLNTNGQYNVNGLFSFPNVLLTATLPGTQGNGIPISGNHCNIGFFSSSPFLTGGINSGNTGNAVVPIGPFTGGVNFTLEASGNYVNFVTGIGNGVFLYTRTFTGDWSLLTGLTTNTLIPVSGLRYSNNTISGSGVFQPNSSVVFQILNSPNPFSTECALLTISGQNVINPIQQLICN